MAILGWEHAGAAAPSWELANALMAWNVGPHGDPPSAVGIRALLDGYRAAAGGLPELDLTTFSGEIAAWLNYVCGQICLALRVTGTDEQQFMERNVNHLLSHAPTRALYERVLEAALVAT